MGGMLVDFLFEPRDLWIGVYWTVRDERLLLVYICLVPTLVIRLSIVRG